jgi:CheY-like chemotaxis protein
MPGDKDFLPWIDEENAGYRFLVYLKREHPDIKVIMLVDYPACEDLRSEMPEILDKGADGYVVKPFVITELVEKIHRISLTCFFNKGNNS